MDSYAFLVAQRDCFSKVFILDINGGVKGLELTVSIEGADKGFLVPLDDLSSHYVNALNIVSAKDWIFRRSKFAGSFEEAVSFLYLEQQLRSLVKSASLKRGVINYFVGLEKKSVTLTLNREQKELDYSNLVASKALEDGYTLQEVKGSHFVITSPTGKKNSTTLNNCTCSEFDEHKDCLHLRLAQVISKERSHLGYLLR